MIKKLYLGIDPDLTKLTVAIISGDMTPLAVFKRTNKSVASDDMKVAHAAQCACDLFDDVVTFIHSELTEHMDENTKLVTIVESQNVMQAIEARKKGNNVRVEDIRKLAQVAGLMMGCFQRISNKMILVQAREWKGTISKEISHGRTYKALGLMADPKKKVSCIYPTIKEFLCRHSADKINMYDFWDINDSLGIAVYGAKRKL